jgi:hypothetical protein
MDYNISKWIWVKSELPVFRDHNDSQHTAVVLVKGDGPIHAIDEFADDKDVWLKIENAGWIRAKHGRFWRVSDNLVAR